MAPEPSPARAFAAPLRRRSATADVSRFPPPSGRTRRQPAPGRPERGASPSACGDTALTCLRLDPTLWRRSTNLCVGASFMRPATLLLRLTRGSAAGRPRQGAVVDRPSSRLDQLRNLPTQPGRLKPLVSRATEKSMSPSSSAILPRQEQQAWTSYSDNFCSRERNSEKEPATSVTPSKESGSA